MNVFAMKKENQAFVGLAVTFDKFMTALENKDLKKQLRDAVALTEEEAKKSEEAREYIAKADFLKADINEAKKHANNLLEAANAIHDEKTKSFEDHQAFMKKSHQDLQDAINKNTQKDRVQKAKDTEQDAREKSLSACQIQLDVIAHELEEKKSALNDRELKLNAKAAALHAVLKD